MENLTVKQMRLIKGKTQEDCAKAIFVHVNTYRRLEANPEEFSVRQAVDLCKFLGCPYNSVNFLSNSST